MIEIARILIPVDFSEGSKHALPYAIAMARWYRSQVTLLHVFVNWPAVNVIPALYATTVQPIPFEQIRQDLTKHAREFVDAERAPDVAIDIVVSEAPDVAGEILDRAAQLPADLLVMGSHGRGGFDRLVLGSTVDKVIRKVACPVMVVPPRAPEVSSEQAVQFRRILCAVDFSPSSIQAATFAMSLAKEANARLTVLHAISVPPEFADASMPTGLDLAEIRRAAEITGRERLEALVPDEVRTYCSVETVGSEGRPSRAVQRFATEQNCDLIVMGVRGRGTLDRVLFGSNTSDVIRSATCPVLIVHAA